ncbi:MAG: riboflavin biosynthesis protein RibD [Gammaproteobacteria bacterium RIFCSPHIGHO2_12_FULL_40_19]|nr:MAG: riboflavin biosynthesis protein RibD [Gammaproteobacteria bacterium RIFCSPHIGHO2_12_FULL_40_19]
MQHADFLLRCVSLATTRLGFCAPNPSVGCVVVKNNQIIAEGFHFGCGHVHAEVDALNKLHNDEARGATVYVSLEPCCHYGRTPPCTERIKIAGIKNVFFGFKDPNPIVAGKGRAALIEAGIACEFIELPEINHFYAAYAYWTHTKMPFVTAKLAMSSDHKIALENKKPARITGEACGLLTHQYRKESDALLTTIETVIHDDPKLNVRLDNVEIQKPLYILDTHCRLPLASNIFQTAQSLIVFHSKKADANTISALEKNKVRCVAIEENKFGLNLNDVLQKIGLDGVQQLWIEAGAKCFNAFLNQQLLHRAIMYISPTALGESALPGNVDFDALKKHAKNQQKSTVGNDTVYFFDLKQHQLNAY